MKRKSYNLCIQLFSKDDKIHLECKIQKNTNQVKRNLLLILGLFISSVTYGQGEEQGKHGYVSQKIKPANKIPVIAKANRATPGALICSTFRDLELVQYLYGNFHNEVLKYRVYGKKRYIRMYGDLPLAPRASNYGCELVEVGVPMLLDANSRYPLLTVTVKLPNGKSVTGITFPYMYKKAPK